MPNSDKLPKERRVLVLLYVLSLYILFQLFWWGFHLIQLNRELLELKSVILGKSQLPVLNSKIWMVAGEGGVFVFLLAIGFWYILRAFRREIRLARMEKTFLLSVTHELKTPIAAVKLQLETLKSPQLTNDQQKKLIDTALRETRRLQDLTENILLATRLDQQGAVILNEHVELNDIVKREVKRYTGLYSIEINATCDHEAAVRGDEYMVTAVVTNLIENAIKYGGGKLITVKTHIVIDEVLLEVSDLGIGIPDNEKDKIFEKFYRVGNEETRTSKGTGLGLYICSTIMKLHQGRIFVNNNHPNGSIFVVAFPHKKQ